MGREVASLQDVGAYPLMPHLTDDARDAGCCRLSYARRMGAARGNMAIVAAAELPQFPRELRARPAGAGKNGGRPGRFRAGEHECC